MDGFIPILLLPLFIFSVSFACIPTVDPDADEWEPESTTSVLATTMELTTTTTTATTTTTTMITCPTTPSMWTINPANNYCYLAVLTGQANWNAAESYCAGQATNGHLVSIENAAENDFIYNMIISPVATPMTVWYIGLIQNAGTMDLSGMSMWRDGTPYDFSVYNNWGSAGVPPMAGGAHCTVMRFDFGDADDGKWEGPACNMMIPFVCKVPATIT